MGITGGFLTAFMVPAMLYLALTRFASALPAYTYTAGDMARAVAALNYGKLARESVPTSDRELMEALRWVIAELTDLHPSLLRDENPRLIEIMEANEGLGARVSA